MTHEDLERRADAGDADAAWLLANRDPEGKSPFYWLERAADLRHPRAQTIIAGAIRNGRRPFDRYGSSASSAVLGLLTDACGSHGNGCYALGEAYEAGYFGAVDLAEARAWFARGAERGDRFSWEKLATFLREGIGGPADLQLAYFWTSLEARCVDPRSVSGQDTWKLREDLAAQLELDALNQQWVAVDAYITEYEAGKRFIYFEPFGAPHSSVRDQKEGSRLAAAKERAHRERLRKDRAPKSPELPNKELERTREPASIK